VNPKFTVYGGGQFTVETEGDVEDNNLATVGATGSLGTDLSVRAEASSGDRGESAVLGADYALDKDQQLYGTYTLSADRTQGKQGVLTVGQRRAVSNQLRVFTEHQFVHERDEAHAARVYGLDYDPTPHTTVGVSVQSSNLEAASRETERNVATVSVGYGRGGVRVGSVVEYRDEAGTKEREQWLTTNSASVRASESLALQGKLSLSHTENEDAERTDAKFVETGIGFAYRPVKDDGLNVLGGYTYLYDLSSESQTDGDGPDERSQVFSIEGIKNLGHHWQMGAKYAHKRGEVRAERDAGDWYETSVNFTACRARYRMGIDWDGLVEYRWLHVKEADDQRQGVLVALYRDVGANLEVGIGYSFVDFTDDLTYLDYDNRGWFVNVIGKY
jgi:hypothetical protein